MTVDAKQLALTNDPKFAQERNELRLIGELQAHLRPGSTASAWKCGLICSVAEYRAAEFCQLNIRNVPVLFHYSQPQSGQRQWHKHILPPAFVHHTPDTSDVGAVSSDSFDIDPREF